MVIAISLLARYVSGWVEMEKRNFICIGRRNSLMDKDDDFMAVKHDHDQECGSRRKSIDVTIITLTPNVDGDR